MASRIGSAAEALAAQRAALTGAGEPRKGFGSDGVRASWRGNGADTGPHKMSVGRSNGQNAYGGRIDGGDGRDTSERGQGRAGSREGPERG